MRKSCRLKLRRIAPFIEGAIADGCGEGVDVACQDTIREIHVDEKVRRYILELVHATREHADVQLGGSPRASIALYRTAQALAVTLRQGRSRAFARNHSRRTRSTLEPYGARRCRATTPLAPNWHPPKE